MDSSVHPKTEHPPSHRKETDAQEERKREENIINHTARPDIPVFPLHTDNFELFFKFRYDIIQKCTFNEHYAANFEITVKKSAS
jgi:hypothetical protein